MRQLTWIRRALRQGDTLTVRAIGPGAAFVVASMELTHAGGGAVCSAPVTTPEGALESLEIALREEMAGASGRKLETHF